ncbi:SCO family protein [Fictibacillus sp. Mic-4]|uniref:SCO family protein n=1 Tax=Fictibacillus sp. Mic-4 TaxID=3132826 RepID=UPI003CF1690E
MKRKMIVPFIILMIVILGIVSYLIWKEKHELPVKQSLPSMTMKKIDGTTYSFGKSKKVRVLELIYTSCPDVCPITTQRLAQLQNELKKDGKFGKEVEFVMVTIDPKVDTPDVLEDYAKRIGLDKSGWVIIRDEEKMPELAKKLGFFVQKTGKTVMHSNTAFLIDKDNNVRAYLPMGTKFDKEDTLDKINSLTKGGLF